MIISNRALKNIFQHQGIANLHYLIAGRGARLRAQFISISVNAKTAASMLSLWLLPSRKTVNKMPLHLCSPCRPLLIPITFQHLSNKSNTEKLNV
jgi:hypothetical protein